jgi:signal peptidase I
VASRWRGVLFSFLVPGAGQFFAGRRVSGLAWHLALLALRVAALLLPGLFIPYGLFASFGLLLLWFVLWIVMLVDSYRPVPEKHWAFLIVMLALGVFVWWGERFFVVRPVVAFKIPGDSMEPTLEPGDRIFVVKDDLHFVEYDRGDVIVFRPPEPAYDPEKPFFIKRIVGLPGEEISIRDGHIMVDGKTVREPAVFREIHYATAPQGIFARQHGGAFRVPEGNYFMIGDNSGSSYDSRHWGPLPRKNVFGRAIYIWWPRERMGPIE